MNRDGVENISAVHLPTRAGFVRRSAQRQQAVSIAAKVRLAPDTLRRAVQTLSGGNQQKVVLAKWLAARPHVLILDEPTRGIDIGAKAEIYEIMRQLADEGHAILFISSELPEILGLSDRILVMRRGQIAAEFDAAEATEESIMRAAVAGEEFVSWTIALVQMDCVVGDIEANLLRIAAHRRGGKAWRATRSVSRMRDHRLLRC